MQPPVSKQRFAQQLVQQLNVDVPPPVELPEVPETPANVPPSPKPPTPLPTLPKPKSVGTVEALLVNRMVPNAGTPSAANILALEETPSSVETQNWSPTKT